MTVYIKMDTPDPLLLSEGVCRQLGILQYHPDVQVCFLKKTQQTLLGSIPEETEKLAEGLAYITPADTIVPTIFVRLIQSLPLLPIHCAVVPVAMDEIPQGTVKLVEPDVSLREHLGIDLMMGSSKPKVTGEPK